jgi:hypothetical protein
LPRIYQRKPDALVAKLTVPMTDDLLRRLREFAETRALTATAAARDILERSLPAPSAK